MRRILLFLAGAVVLTLPAAAAARPQEPNTPGFLVVRNASTDGGVAGNSVATVVVRGFVIGKIVQEGEVELFHIGSATAPQAAGLNVSRRQVYYRGVVPGTEFSGSGFRFRAVGGVWRVVVHGAGISLYAGGEGRATLHGEVAYPEQDGVYSFDGAPFTSLPSGTVTRKIGAK